MSGWRQERKPARQSRQPSSPRRFTKATSFARWRRACPRWPDFARIARLYGLVYSPVTDRSGLEPAISDAIEKATPTMVVVKFKRDDSVSGHRLCWEAAAAALRD